MWGFFCAFVGVTGHTASLKEPFFNGFIDSLTYLLTYSYRVGEKNISVPLSQTS